MLREFRQRKEQDPQLADRQEKKGDGGSDTEMRNQA